MGSSFCRNARDKLQNEDSRFNALFDAKTVKWTRSSHCRNAPFKLQKKDFYQKALFDTKTMKWMRSSF